EMHTPPPWYQTPRSSESFLPWAIPSVAYGAARRHIVTPIRAGYKLTIILLLLTASLAADEKPAFEQMLPRIAPLEPHEALKSFRIKKGFHIELVAAEPQITDPCAIEWDEAGRLYVCELWNYPYLPKANEPLGRIRVLEDADGDGY